MNRFTSLRAVAALASLSIVLAACGGGGSAIVSPGVPATGMPSYDTSAIPTQLQIKSWGKSMLAGATYVGPVTNANLSVNVLVHQQSPDALLQYAAQVSDPSSPSFRKWLTPQEIADRFGASQSDYNKAAQYFASQGLAVGAWPQRMVLAVSGPQASMQRAFNTTFGQFQRDGVAFVAPMSAPHFSQVVPVDAVGRLVTYSRMHTYLMDPPRIGSGTAIGYSPQQIRAAFDYNNAYGVANGSNITIGIIGTGPIDSYAGGTGDRDLDALKTLYNNLPVAHVTQVNVTALGVSAGLGASGIPTTAPSASPAPNAFPYSGAFQSPPPLTAPCTGKLPACNAEDGEAQLDVQQAATLAPGSAVHFYLAYNAADCTAVYYPNTCPSSGANVGTPQIGIAEADAEIQQVIADNTADVISMSYGAGESQQGFSSYSAYRASYSSYEFAELSVEGIAAFASSGDSGSAECLAGISGYLPQPCVSYPAGDPNVTSVGGVTAYINSLGALASPVLAWGISTGDTGYGTVAAYGASGGGTSAFFPAPTWQSSALGNTLREQPDVSLIGDPADGVALEENASYGGKPSGIGGTSVAAPQMAATWALVLSACRAHPGSGLCNAAGSGAWWRLGNASPYLYAILKGSAIGGSTPRLPYSSVFYDVLYGSNEMASNGGAPSAPVPGANAMTGYDEVTGVGVPYAGHLIQAITGISVL